MMSPNPLIPIKELTFSRFSRVMSEWKSGEQCHDYVDSQVCCIEWKEKGVELGRSLTSNSLVSRILKWKEMHHSFVMDHPLTTVIPRGGTWFPCSHLWKHRYQSSDSSEASRSWSQGWIMKSQRIFTPHLTRRPNISERSGPEGHQMLKLVKSIDDYGDSRIHNNHKLESYGGFVR